MEKQELITIQGKKLTNDFLLNKARNIANVANALDLTISSMEHYLLLKVLGHSEYFNYYLNSGEFENTVDCLRNLKDTIQSFSDDLVPDDDNDRKIYQRQLKNRTGD